MLVILALAACSRPGDATFSERDQQLLAQFEKLHTSYQHGQLSRDTYRSDLQKLHERELKLFAEVKQHNFSDITESNYWHRGRLKFPGVIEQELTRLQSEVQKSP